MPGLENTTNRRRFNFTQSKIIKRREIKNTNESVPFVRAFNRENSRSYGEA